MYDGDIRKDENMKRLLIEKAIEKLPNSYAPYSRYNVAAAALFDSGEIYTGVNVESASLGATICAERNAIFHAVAEGEKHLIAVAVVGGLNGDRSEYCVPCGICRQVMRDFGDKDSTIILSAKTPDDYMEKTLDEMLPDSFGPESLD
jgi:cytidine deaminase